MPLPPEFCALYPWAPACAGTAPHICPDLWVSPSAAVLPLGPEVPPQTQCESVQILPVPRPGETLAAIWQAKAATGVLEPPYQILLPSAVPLPLLLLAQFI